MGRPKGARNKPKSIPSPDENTKEIIKPKILPKILSVGDSIKIPNILETVTIDSIEAVVEKVDAEMLQKPTTILCLSNGRWLRGSDYIAILNKEKEDKIESKAVLTAV